MTKVLNGLFSSVTMACLMGVVGSTLAQETSVRSRVVTRTQKDGRVSSGVERYSVVGVGRSEGLSAVAGKKAPTGLGRIQPRPNGIPGVTINSAGFGSVALGSSTTMNLVFDATAGPLTFTSSTNLDFAITSTSCDNSCSVHVTFTPPYPGLRSSVIRAKNGSGGLVAETFVYGTGTGPLVGFELGYETIFTTSYSSQIQQPTGVALGPDRTAYFTDAGTKQVYSINRYDPTNPYTLTTLGISGLGTPSGISVDGNNTVYVADKTNNAIVTYTADGMQGTVTTSALSSPGGLAVDGTGALYIADTGNGRVIRIDNQGAETTLASGITSPQGIVVDSAGDVFFNDNGSSLGGTITELPAGGGAAVHFGSGLGNVQALALDAGGTIYYSTATLLGLLTTDGGLSINNYGSNAPTGIAVAANGDLYTALGAGGEFDTTDRSSGNFILNAAVGGSAQGGLTLRNVGNSALTLSNVATSEAQVYTLDSSSVCAAGYVVNPAATCGVTVSYNPTTPGPDQQTVNVTSDSLNAAGTVNEFIIYGYAGQTGTQLAVSSSSVAAGQPVTFTATVSSQNGSSFPTGTVQFVDYDTVLGTGTLVQNPDDSSQSIATLTTSSLSVGSHSVVAMYLGSGTQATSSSDAQAVTVVAGTASTTTALAVSPATVRSGQAETLTATIVGGASPVVTGTVTFYDSPFDAPNIMLGSTAVMATSTGGMASLTLTTLAVGSHTIYASYGGDGNYAGSASGTQTVTVTAGPAATSTTLTVDRASVVFRTPVAFTASVISGSAAVTAGQVIFCDAAAAYCNLDQNLATAQLNSSGVAVARMAAGVVGSHGYRAVFVGTSSFAVSPSATVTVGVTAPPSYGTFTTLAQSGSAGNYTLTGSVTGLQTRALAPGGTVTFSDASNGNAVLGTATLGAAVLGFRELQPAGSPLAVGSHPYGVATGDFNGDGYPDVVVENYNGNSVSVLLGMGNGGFQPAVSYAVGSLPERVLVADFNGDGRLDLVVANTGSGTVSVLLGNGDGTFQTQVTYGCSSPVGLGVMDLNHDGFADIVAGDYYSNTVSVLLGRGDGTFQAAVTYATGSTPQTLAEGDFNGDGNVDLAVGNLNSGTVGILLGNGDGTFQAQVSYAVGGQPQGVQVGDFNRDGIDDLAVVNSRDNTVSILLGNGDGTFRAQVTYAVGADPVGIVAGDFNGDGYLDLSVGNTAQTALTQSVLLGNGDGTFQAQTVYPTGNFPYGEAVADFNGDGFPDLAIANFSDNTATILLSFVTQTAMGTITGVSPGGAAGAHPVTATYSGDANFVGSTSLAVVLTVTAPAATATSLTIRPGAATVGQAVGFFASVFGTTQTTPAATGTVTLMNNSVSPAAVLGTIALGSTGGGSLSTASLAPGSYSVTAIYGGDAVYAGSVSGAQTLVVSQAATTAALSVSAANLTVGQVETLNVNLQGGGGVGLTGTVTFFDGTVVLGTSAVSGSSPGGSTASATASVTASSLGVGVHQITARYGGDANYSGSVSAAQTVTVGQVATTTTLGVSAASIQVNQAETLTATVAGAAGVGLTGTVTFFDGTAVVGTGGVAATGTGGTATVTLTGIAAGTRSYSARYGGDANDAASGSGVRTVTVSLLAQTIAFPAIANHTVGDAAFAPGATASSGLAVTYAVASGPATVSGGLLTVTGAGTVVVQASQAGNATYAAAGAVTQSFTVTSLPVVTLAGISPASGVVGAGATTVTLTGTNFAARDLVQWNGVGIGSSFVNGTTLTAVVPASLLQAAGTGQITVVDPLSGAVSGAAAFTVVARPAVVFSGPSASTSGQQPSLTLQLVNPYPAAITGTLTLTFAPVGAAAVDDPAVQFATGGRTLAFTIAANSTVTPAVLLQTGTVAGTATVTLGLVSGGVNVTPANAAPVVIAIATAVPSVTTATLARAGNTMSVVVHGFSNTREVATAMFHFVPVAGSTVNDPDVTVNVAAEFAGWYGSAASGQYGSSFTYTQQFTLDRDVSTIGSVTVTLVNAVGNSVAASVQ